MDEWFNISEPFLTVGKVNSYGTFLKVLELFCDYDCISLLLKVAGESTHMDIHK